MNLCALSLSSKTLNNIGIFPVTTILILINCDYFIKYKYTLNTLYSLVEYNIYYSSVYLLFIILDCGNTLKAKTLSNSFYP